mmetsp:Transcript_76750/g.203626  ORF Transcript_76750/g.203626 Transcript_76750/m.203626 type:complete len:282 (-) Transcript_76750:46-891(-)
MHPLLHSMRASWASRSRHLARTDEFAPAGRQSCTYTDAGRAHRGPQALLAWPGRRAHRSWARIGLAGIGAGVHGTPSNVAARNASILHTTEERRDRPERGERGCTSKHLFTRARLAQQVYIISRGYNIHWRRLRGLLWIGTNRTSGRGNGTHSATPVWRSGPEGTKNGTCVQCCLSPSWHEPMIRHLRPARTYTLQPPCVAKAMVDDCTVYTTCWRKPGVHHHKDKADFARLAGAAKALSVTFAAPARCRRRPARSQRSQRQPSRRPARAALWQKARYAQD